MAQIARPVDSTPAWMLRARVKKHKQQLQRDRRVRALDDSAARQRLLLGALFFGQCVISATAASHAGVPRAERWLALPAPPPTALLGGALKLAPPPAPPPLCPAEPAYNITRHIDFAYQPLTTPPAVFAPGGPRAADVAQGHLRDCFLVAALASYAHTRPHLLAERIERVSSPHDETPHYRVRLKIRDGWRWVIVSARFLLSRSGQHMGAVLGVLWPSLFEKAIAVVHGAATADRGGYLSIDQGGRELGLLTLGGGAFDVSATNDTFFAALEQRRATAILSFMPPWNLPQHPDYDAQSARITLPDGSVIQPDPLRPTRAIRLNTAANTSFVLLGRHMYSLLEVYGDWVLIRNPWARNPVVDHDDLSADATFWLPRAYLPKVVNAFIGAELSPHGMAFGPAIPNTRGMQRYSTQAVFCTLEKFIKERHCLVAETQSETSA